MDIVLTSRTRWAYYSAMNDLRHVDHAPTDLLDVLAESEADIAVGRVVPGDVVMQDLRDGLARLEAKAAAKRGLSGAN